MAFAEIFKANRKRMGFTQEEIANRLMVTPQAVSKWETGIGTPDISLLVPISRSFGITIDELLENDNKEYEEILDELDEVRNSDIEISLKYKKHIEALKQYPNNKDIITRTLGFIASWLSNKKREMEQSEINNLLNTARELSERLRDIKPLGNDFTYSHAFLADVYMGADEFEDAEKEIQFLPYSRYGKARMLGNLRIRERKYGEALEQYRESISDAINWLCWDIERSAQCIWKMTDDNSVPLKIFKLEYDLIHLLYQDNMYPIPLSSNLMYVNMQLAANSTRCKDFNLAYMHIEEILTLAEMHEAKYGKTYETGCILYPNAMQPFNKVNSKKKSYKNWILRSLKWNSFDEIKDEERFINCIKRAERLE